MGIQQKAGLIGEDSRHLFESLTQHLDKERGDKQPAFGGLQPYILKEDGRLLWLCNEHRLQYENTARPA